MKKNVAIAIIVIFIAFNIGMVENYYVCAECFKGCSEKQYCFLFWIHRPLVFYSSKSYFETAFSKHFCKINPEMQRCGHIKNSDYVTAKVVGSCGLLKLYIKPRRIFPISVGNYGRDYGFLDQDFTSNDIVLLQKYLSGEIDESVLQWRNDLRDRYRMYIEKNM